MMYRFYLMCILLIFALPIAAAQRDDVPDYRVQVFPDYEVTETEVILTYAVYNQGASADRVATVELVDAISGDVITTGEVEPLGGSGDLVEQTIAFAFTRFASGSTVVVRIDVGIGEIEPEGSVTTFNNRSDSVTITIPEYTTAEATQAATDTNDTASADDSSIIQLPFDLTIDLSDSEEVTILGGIAASFILMLLIVIMVLRLLFQRTPTFGNWQPPYATMPPHDPNSTQGRRQNWQQHAQNNAIPSPCRPGTIYARKVLMGMDGHYLSGWQVKAIRLTQYDMYGRVSRSQVLASNRLVKRLDGAVRKIHKLDERKMAGRVRPIARSLANQFKKRINKRSAMLPIALDVRVQGVHGEVRIVFELYDCENNQPILMDYWEPEMVVRGKDIFESYTFTIYGQRADETYKVFRKQLAERIEQALVDMLRTSSRMTTTTQSPVPTDTLSNMEPVSQQDVLE